MLNDNTVIYGFNVNVPTNISKMAARDGVAVRNYRVIYELLDDAKSSMENLLDAGLSEECTDKCMKMLDNGESYSAISAQTGASTATISRVSKAYEYGAGGYKTVISRCKEK